MREPVLRLRTEAQDHRVEVAELRELVKKTQVEIAQALGVTQPSVSEMEKRGKDLKLSSLNRYVKAAGGKLRLYIELPNGIRYAFSF